MLALLNACQSVGRHHRIMQDGQFLFSMCHAHAALQGTFQHSDSLPYAAVLFMHAMHYISHLSPVSLQALSQHCSCHAMPCHAIRRSAMHAEVTWTQHHFFDHCIAADVLQSHALQSAVEQGPGSEGGQEEDLGLTDMRVRLLAGLKRYLHGKRLNGLLSSQVRSHHITTRQTPIKRPCLPLHASCKKAFILCLALVRRERSIKPTRAWPWLADTCSVKHECPTKSGFVLRRGLESLHALHMLFCKSLR